MKIYNQMRIVAAVLSVLTAFVLTGCVCDHPDCTRNVVLKLEFDDDMPLYEEVDYTRASESGYDVRYIIEIFQAAEDGSFSTVADSRIVETSTSMTDYSIPLLLESGDYRFMVWADYVVSGSTADNFYDTSDFSAISLRGDYVGVSDYRDAFRGSIDCTVSDDSTITIEMVRPLAKLIFVSDDLDEFAASILASQSQSDQTRSGLDVNDYTVVFYYPSYLPSVFNMYTDRPADSVTGISFESIPVQLDEARAQMGFDYVFVNGTEASVTVALAVFDANGNELSGTGSIEVPLVRGHYTLVTGNFFTAESSRSISVDPGYDGDYNIEIK